MSASHALCTLLYHDVVEPGCEDASGFAGGAAALYKLTLAMFEQHLEKLRAAAPGPPALSTVAGGRWMLHFDDGGASALLSIAPRLEALGWRGHFFIATRYLGSSGFLEAEGVRELHRRGHVVGSHSWSHPERIVGLAPEQMLEEWRRSRAELETILGAPVTTASVPGGFYSREVARSAARAGIRLLFNSEPVTTPGMVDGTEVRGRFNINRRTQPASAAGLVRGRAHLRASQYLLWNTKKLGKTLFWPLYKSIRKRVLEP